MAVLQLVFERGNPQVQDEASAAGSLALARRSSACCRPQRTRARRFMFFFLEGVESHTWRLRTSQSARFDIQFLLTGWEC